MLVVLDAGVFVSAAITPKGIASQIITAGIGGRFEYLICPRLVNEITDVLGRPKITRLIDHENGQRFLADALAAGRDVSDPLEISALCRDPDDDYLFALAYDHQVAWIITGDGDLHALTNPTTPVIGLRPFLDLMALEL